MLVGDGTYFDDDYGHTEVEGFSKSLMRLRSSFLHNDPLCNPGYLTALMTTEDCNAENGKSISYFDIRTHVMVENPD